MKKSISIIFLITIFITVCSCAKKQPGSLPSSSELVTDEAFETMKLNYIDCDYYTCASLEELIETSDLILVVSTDKSFTEIKSAAFDEMYNPVGDFNDVSMANSYTARRFKVHKVLKGDKKLKTVLIGESAIHLSENGNEEIFLFDGETITKKNAKYLVFLQKAVLTPDLYYAALKQGKYNADGADTDSLKHVDKAMEKAVKDYYKSEFKN